MFLFLAARIDHGHHASQPVLALHDTIEMARAVERVKNITKKGMLSKNSVGGRSPKKVFWKIFAY